MPNSVELFSQATECFTFMVEFSGLKIRTRMQIRPKLPLCACPLVHPFTCLLTDCFVITRNEPQMSTWEGGGLVEVPIGNWRCRLGAMIQFIYPSKPGTAFFYSSCFFLPLTTKQGLQRQERVGSFAGPGISKQTKSRHDPIDP